MKSKGERLGWDKVKDFTPKGTKKMKDINCLSYALRFWDKNTHYRIWYNSDHAINLPIGSSATGFLPIEPFGLGYFKSSFKGLLSRSDMRLLNEYFEGIK